METLILPYVATKEELKRHKEALARYKEAWRQEIAAQLRARRQALELKQEGVGAKVSRTTISNIERGIANPQLNKLLELGFALKVPVGFAEPDSSEDFVESIDIQGLKTILKSENDTALKAARSGIGIGMDCLRKGLGKPR